MKRKLRLTFFAKNMLMITIGIFLVGGLLTGINVKMQQKMALDNLRTQYAGVSNYVREQIGAGLIAEAAQDPKPDNEVGKQLTALLDDVSKTNPNVAQAYVFSAEVENGAQQVVGTPSHLIEDGMVPGTLYENPAEMQKVIQKVIEQKAPSGTNVYTDIYGSWVSVLQPVTDDSGEVIAVLGIDISAADIAANTKQLLSTSLLVLALCAVFVLAIQFVLMRRMMKPVRDLFKAIGQMSDGDLNVELHTERRDDFGDLNRQFAAMADEMKSIISGVQSRAQLAAESSAALKSGVEQNVRIQDGVVETAERVSRGARTQETAAEETARVMEEMSRAIQEIAQTAYGVSEAASDMKTEAGSGGASIARVARQMSAISESVGRSASRIRQLQERSREVEGIAELISGIASQTNLLALNAAIEAARAGDHGKGFAVVAEEVRKLADQSAQSAGQISGILGLMIRETDEAVVLMEEGIQEVQTGLELSEQTGEAFRRIETAIDSVSTQTEDMSAVTEQMSASSEEVSASVSELAGIAKDSAGSAIEVTQASQIQRESLDSVSSSSEDLNAMAVELSELIAKFKI
ncbi:methyl-accepting chemotaxis protein [Saccharibacillus alkalitolerans]|uniref:HAMP domain-containing protein n=1 Tax=Saccharibacillus alkalitolerans TaxID=2705290 RepID=A0ABX0F9M4_9BACL|nr:methyl-accepting chemotaxis protein [Saccharibacillus alkalitolerans]NGZ77023.1 HAMP domain-containing protein [Saccharibacillus alkalitolerans]